MGAPISLHIILNFPLSLAIAYASSSTQYVGKFILLDSSLILSVFISLAPDKIQLISALRQASSRASMSSVLMLHVSSDNSLVGELFIVSEVIQYPPIL